MAARKAATETVRVRVAAHTQVWHEGRLYVAGEELEAPRDGVADSWIANGWAIELEPKPKGGKGEPSRLVPPDGGWPTAL